MFRSPRPRGGEASSAPSEDSRGWSRKPTSIWRRFLELFVLSGFAVAQPTLDVFSQAGETFVFRRIDRTGILLFTVVVIFATPMVMWFIGLAAARLSVMLGAAIHDAFMGALWIVLGLEIFQRLEKLPLAAMFAGGLAFGVGALAVSLARREPGLWITYATPAPIVFGLVFLLLSPVSGQVQLSGEVGAIGATVRNPAPVVVLVLDELPLASLIGPDWRLDAELFPNLSRLQHETHTFLNATSNSAHTAFSVPSLLTGQLPRGRVIPVATTHPNNLFTLLGSSHDLRIHELLRLCPTSLCPQEHSRGLWPVGFGGLLRDGLLTFGRIVDPRDQPSAAGSGLIQEAAEVMNGATRRDLSSWSSSDLRVPGRFDAFIRDLSRPTRSARPVLGFMHLVLPHGPWQRIPDGRVYPLPPDGALPGLEGETWSERGTFLALARQRHLLQVQYADRLVGELVRGLKQMDLWNRSTVVITADHGVNFVRGEGARAVTENNADAAWVPLFIKEPGQQSGTTSDENVQLVDVLPTLADILGIDVPWRLDGRSVFAGSRRLTEPRPFFYDGRTLKLDGLNRRRELLKTSIATFAPFRGDPLREYRVGSYGALVGRSVTDLPTAPISKPVSAQFDVPGMWGALDMSAPLLPVYAAGRIHDPERVVTRLVISVNGVVAATSELAGTSDNRVFAGMIPPSLLKDGWNDVRVYALDASGVLATIPLNGQ